VFIYWFIGSFIYLFIIIIILGGSILGMLPKVGDDPTRRFSQIGLQASYIYIKFKFLKHFSIFLAA
jgi:hypothetical protein